MRWTDRTAAALRACLVTVLCLGMPQQVAGGDWQAVAAAPLERADSVATVRPSQRQPVAAHLRAQDPVARALIEEGFRRSATIRQKALALDGTDAIVYVATDRRNCRGRPTTALLSSAEGTRYLSITIPTMTCGSLSRSERPTGTSELIAWLGHELCHTLEIGLEPHVRDQDGMRQLFGRIGYWHAQSSGYETVAAIEAQRAIARELSKK